MTAADLVDRIDIVETDPCLPQRVEYFVQTARNIVQLSISLTV